MTNYVVIDMEMCRVPRHKKCKEYSCTSEIIQIGAVLLDEQYQIISEFITNIKPQYGEIDPFIEKLTGIRRRDVFDAPYLSQAMQAMFDWIEGREVCFISWSFTDRDVIRRECTVKGILNDALTQYLEGWGDCQKTFSDKMGVNRQYSLSEALVLCDLEFDENIHNALTDAKNTALLFEKLQTEQELVLNSYFVREEEGADQRYI